MTISPMPATASPGDFRPTFATNRPASGETVAAAVNTLLNGMRQHLAQPPRIAIATAYFNPAGFGLLADELEQVGRVRLLLGAEPEIEQARIRRLTTATGLRAQRETVRRALEGHDRNLTEDRNLVGFTREADAQAHRLVDWLHGTFPDGTPRVEVRRYENGFLHGKAFLLDTAIPGVVAGSTNFTFAGLARNKELNLGQYQPDTVAAVLSWFNEMWAESSPYDLATLYEARWEPHLPWHVFLRMLWELYGGEIEEEQDARLRSRLGLTGFQMDGVWRAKRILARRGGVIVADEVGLGKTFIAGEMIHEAVFDRRQKVLVVAPATLRDSTWDPFLREHNLRADVISFDELVANLERAGALGTALQMLDEYAMIVVDEAHALRNASTRRADAIRELLAGGAPKDAVFLTATPVNNSLLDLYNLISYFVPNDAAFTDAGVPSLRGYFDRAMSMHPDDLSPQHLFDVIDQVAVRRTRRFVKNHYVGDRVTIDGVSQEIRFPTPRVHRVDYDLEQVLPGLFGRLAVALGAHLDEAVMDAGAVLAAPGEVLTLARYVPSRFRFGADGLGEQYERQNAGLLRSALLKRFESSTYAFRRTVETMIVSHDRFLDALDRGYVLTGDALREWATSDSDSIEEFLENYDDGDGDNIAPANHYDKAALTEAVQADRDLLDSLHNEVRILGWDEDPKTQALLDELAQIAADAAIEGIGEQDTRDKRKVLIFSYYADTVEHLTTQIRTAIEQDPRLATYRDRIATASGPDRTGRAEVIAGFAPHTAGGPGADDRYDLLIATDVLAEGVNLQQARHIINYDLPWNPMRLVQRHGRIDRIGSRHREVFLRCFFPDQHLEALLGLEERLQRKLKQAAAATGIGIVLPGVAAREITFTETREEIERLRAEEATLFEEGGASALSGEEYRRRIERAFTNPLTKQTVLSLPWGSGTGYTRLGADPGLAFCVRIGDHPKPWFRYVPLNSDLTVQVDPTGKPIVVDDTLACLAASDPTDVDTPPVLTDEMYQAAFDAWAAAKSHIHAAWMFNADPANLTRPVPRVMRDAAELVRTHGQHLGDLQDDLVDRLEAPYAPRILRLVRDELRREDGDRNKVDRLLDLANRIPLIRQPDPEPLPAITNDDIHLVCWTAITPAGSDT
jgi:superfamily II DNA or RNA helicase